MWAWPGNKSRNYFCLPMLMQTLLRTSPSRRSECTRLRVLEDSALLLAFGSHWPGSSLKWQAEQKCEAHLTIYLPARPSTLRNNARMVPPTETPAQSGRASSPPDCLRSEPIRVSVCTRSDSIRTIGEAYAVAGDPSGGFTQAFAARH